MVTVSELIERLSDLPPEALVLVASDEEGSDILALDDVDLAYTVQDEVEPATSLDIFFEDDVMDDNDGSVPSEFTEVAILWP